jgi:hypothetical protein
MHASFSPVEKPLALLFIFKSVRGTQLFFVETFNPAMLMEKRTYLELDRGRGGLFER